jgi:predicted glycosyltransferase
MLSERILAPAVIPDDRLVAQGLDLKKLLRYSGLKEEVYVYDLCPDLGVIEKLGLDRDRVIVTLRPPATWAHYHHERSEVMFAALMDRLKREPGVQVVIPARTKAQEQELRQKFELSEDKFNIFTSPVDGLSLMWCSDVVFSGGGTMTREAALLGLNVYSIFGGKLGAGDESLIRDGKLKLLRQPAELDEVNFRKGQLRECPPPDQKKLAHQLAGEIVRFAEECAR